MPPSMPNIFAQPTGPGEEILDDNPLPDPLVMFLFCVVILARCTGEHEKD
jgi:hypothetical protein